MIAIFDLLLIIMAIVVGILTLKAIFTPFTRQKSFDEEWRELHSPTQYNNEELRKLEELKTKKQILIRQLGTKEDLIKLQEEINVLENSMLNLDDNYSKVYINRTGPRPKTWGEKGGKDTYRTKGK